MGTFDLLARTRSPPRYGECLLASEVYKGAKSRLLGL